MELEDFLQPDEPDDTPAGGSPHGPPSAAALALAQLIASGLSQPAASMSPEPNAPLSAGDLCDHYIAGHQPTVFAEGRFWRYAYRHGPWQPVPDPLIEREVFDTLQSTQAEGLPPTPQRIAAVIALLRLRLDEVAPGHWDNPVGFLPLRSNLLAEDAFEFTTYTPDHYVATTLPYDYDASAQAPAWQHFLETTIPEAAPFLQEFAGYCLLPGNAHELSLWLYGPPASGKATCLLGLQTLLGPFAGVLALEEVAARRLDPAVLHRKRLLICHEPPVDRATVGFLRRLVAGQPLSFRRPFRASVTVQSSARLALSFHTLPSLDPQFASLYHRAALVVFPGRPHGQHDPTLKARLAQEGPGLFNWARAGLRRLQLRGGFAPPATMLAAAERLRLTHAAPAVFLQQCCALSPNGRAQAAHLHHAFVAWCQQLGLQPISSTVLAREWQRLGLIRHRLAGVSYWFGVELLPAATLPPAALSGSAPSAPTAPPEN
jgi:putative DNA primase/helicase